jgi:dCMP deaminase
MKWDEYYLGMAKYVSKKSKDPSTKCGAVVVRSDNTVASIGFNGLPRGVIDSDDRLHDREKKLDMTLHAEQNAILSAHERLDGCTLYVWPMPPCSHCAGVVIQAGIDRVVAPEPGERWARSCRLGRSMMWEAGVGQEWIDD